MIGFMDGARVPCKQREGWVDKATDTFVSGRKVPNWREFIPDYFICNVGQATSRMKKDT